MSTSSRKKAPYTPCVFFLTDIGNLLDNGDTSTPLSRSTRASSPARLRSWLFPVKNVMLRPSLPPRPVSAGGQSGAPPDHESSLTSSADPVDVVLSSQREAVIKHATDVGDV